MIKNKKILAVIPARGGSKGIPLKNIAKLNGKPLIQIVGEVVSKLDILDRAIVSTDNELIAKTAITAGLDVPFTRPSELSGDVVSDVEVLTHAINEIEKIDKKRYDIIVMLQPTSPMRKVEHVKQAIEKLIYEDWDSVWTISETDSKNHPLKQLIVKDNSISYYDILGSKVIARQQLEKTYHKNGVAYVMTRECIIKHKSIKGTKTGSYIIHEKMANIDTLDDFKYADYLCSL